MKKKILASLATLCMLIALSGCSDGKKDFGAFEKLVDDGLIAVEVGVINECAETVSGAIAIPPYIAAIQKFAFSRCDRLESVYISGGTEYIGLCAFTDCTMLSEVYMESGIESIGQSAFDNCKGLKKITLSDTIQKIHIGAFSRCTSLTTITIPDSVEFIGSGAFDDCTALTTVHLGNGIRGVKEDFFDGCTNLTNITYKGKTYSYETRDALYDAINDQ